MLSAVFGAGCSVPGGLAERQEQGRRKSNTAEGNCRCSSSLVLVGPLLGSQSGSWCFREGRGCHLPSVLWGQTPRADAGAASGREHSCLLRGLCGEDSSVLRLRKCEQKHDNLHSGRRGSSQSRAEGPAVQGLRSACHPNEPPNRPAGRPHLPCQHAGHTPARTAVRRGFLRLPSYLRPAILSGQTAASESLSFTSSSTTPRHHVASAPRPVGLSVKGWLRASGFARRSSNLAELEALSLLQRACWPGSPAPFPGRTQAWPQLLRSWGAKAQPLGHVCQEQTANDGPCEFTVDTQLVT